MVLRIEKWAIIFDQAGIEESVKNKCIQEIDSNYLDMDDLLPFEDSFILCRLEKYMKRGIALKVLRQLKKHAPSTTALAMTNIEINSKSTAAPKSIGDATVTESKGDTTVAKPIGELQPDVVKTFMVPKEFPSSVADTIDPRRLNYIAWSNSTEIRKMFREQLNVITRTLSTKCLELSGGCLPAKDFLNVWNNLSDRNANIIAIELQVKIEVKHTVLCLPIQISSEVIMKHRCTSATSDLNRLGCQHVYCHAEMVDSNRISSEKNSRRESTASVSSKHMTDSSLSMEGSVGSTESLNLIGLQDEVDSEMYSDNYSNRYTQSSASDQDIEESEAPKPKKQKRNHLKASQGNPNPCKTSQFSQPSLPTDPKTWQIAKYSHFKGDLDRHLKNSSLCEDKVHAEIVIFINDDNICEQLSEYFGLLYLEKIAIDAGVGANLAEVLHICTFNDDAELHRMIQAEINRRLFAGYNNIALTYNYNLFTQMQAEVKAVIFKPEDYLNFSDLPTYAYYLVDIDESSDILSYVCAMTDIINAVLKVDSHLDAIFLNDTDKKYYKVKFPLFSAIPFYVLKFFARVVIVDNPRKHIEFSFREI